MRHRTLFLTLLLTLPLFLHAQNEAAADSVAQDSTLQAPSDTAACAVRDTLPWPQGLQHRLDALVQSEAGGLLATSQMAMSIYDLTDDSLLYAYQPRQTLRPASTEKLITAITALTYLGGSYTFDTRLCTTGQVTDHVLQGDVYLVGGFDPRFNNDDMESFIEALQRQKIDTLRGRIFADISMKDTLRWGNGWCWDDDNPTLTPLLISGRDRFMPTFLRLLRKAGIVADSTYSLAFCPPEATMLTRRSHAFDQILMRMMKESDNLYAESMFYQLAAKSGRRYASNKEAVRYINNLITQLGYDPRRYEIVDGSGLSLYNYLSPELEVAFLRYAYRQPNVYNHLYQSLPIAGQDGTLSRRMRRAFTRGNVRAKTGTVEGVSTLAGYATAPNSHAIAFSIMNQGILHTSSGHSFQGRVCEAICAQ
jgi:D-alanyl-D-alanine carboxypeptidase/D-alanyl-D-alanine-endopeptidase (penicillin-binding protein 4)